MKPIGIALVLAAITGLVAYVFVSGRANQDEVKTDVADGENDLRAEVTDLVRRTHRREVPLPDPEPPLGAKTFPLDQALSWLEALNAGQKKGHTIRLP